MYVDIYIYMYAYIYIYIFYYYYYYYYYYYCYYYYTAGYTSTVNFVVNCAWPSFTSTSRRLYNPS
jgi:hypothetical protein